MHVSDLFSKDFPIGNAAASLSYVHDPIGTTTIPLHILWDTDSLRIPTVEEVGRATREFTEKYPRSFYPELQAHPVSDPDVFRKWAREGHQVAVDWAYGILAIVGRVRPDSPG